MKAYWGAKRKKEGKKSRRWTSHVVLFRRCWSRHYRRNCFIGRVFPWTSPAFSTRSTKSVDRPVEFVVLCNEQRDDVFGRHKGWIVARILHATERAIVLRRSQFVPSALNRLPKRGVAQANLRRFVAVSPHM